MNYAASPKVAGSIPGKFIDCFFNLLNAYNHNMVLKFTQLLSEISIRNLPGSKAPLSKADNLAAICEPIF
jgi:hypothetical protein